MLQQNQNKSNHPLCRFTLTAHSAYRFRTPFLVILTCFLFTFLSQLPQSLSHSAAPSPPPPQSVLVESSPVAPPSFDQWQQQQQDPSGPSAAVERSVLSEEMARKRAGEYQARKNRMSLLTLRATEDEFTNDLREAQRELESGGVRVGMANDVVRDTRDALIRRGNQLQVTCDR